LRKLNSICPYFALPCHLQRHRISPHKRANQSIIRALIFPLTTAIIVPIRKESSIQLRNDDTIAAIITPPGDGGLGAIRIAGPESLKIVNRVFRPRDRRESALQPFHLYHGYIMDKNGAVIDEVTTVVMPEGRSYTGQLQAEIFCHGGQFVLRRILEEILRQNARPAEPGEFTRRAFLSGRIDLARAEAVADLVASKTTYAYNVARNNLLGRLSQEIDSVRNKIIDLLADIEAAVDYPEEALETAGNQTLETSLREIIGNLKNLIESYRSGRIIKEGFKIAITGRPNAGKSSLFNLLLNQNRAIVASIPGTTRDYLSEWIDLDGLAVQLTDTAGLRGKAGVIEKAGQASAQKIIEESDLVIWLVDITRKGWKKEIPADLKNLSNRIILLLYNKIDKAKRDVKASLKSIDFSVPSFPVSCLTGEGMTDFRRYLKTVTSAEFPDLTDRLVITSERHQVKLKNASRHFKKARLSLKKQLSPELTAFDLRQGLNEIDEITGRVYNEQVLDRIFSRFCIGK